MYEVLASYNKFKVDKEYTSVGICVYKPLRCDIVAVWGVDNMSIFFIITLLSLLLVAVQSVVSMFIL